MGQAAGHVRVAGPAQAKLSTDAVVRIGVAAISHESERLRAVAQSLRKRSLCCALPRALSAHEHSGA